MEKYFSCKKDDLLRSVLRIAPKVVIVDVIQLGHRDKDWEVCNAMIRISDFNAVIAEHDATLECRLSKKQSPSTGMDMYFLDIKHF